MHATLNYHVSEKERSAHPDFGLGLLNAVLSSRSQVRHTLDALHPNCSCYFKTTGRYCRNPDCRQHGHHERNRRAALWAQFDPSGWDVYSVTLAYSGYVIESQYLRVRESFRTSLRLELRGHGYKDYCFRTEFVNVRPHLHWLFRLPEGSDFKAVSEIVRRCWKDALLKEGIWRSQHVGIDDKLSKTPYDIWKLSDYCYSTNFSSWRLNNCRPCEWRSRLTFRSRGWSDKSYSPTADDCIAEIARGLGLLVVQSSNSPSSCRRVYSPKLWGVYRRLKAALCPLGVLSLHSTRGVLRNCVGGGASRWPDRMTRDDNTPNGHSAAITPHYAFHRTLYDTS